MDGWYYRLRWRCRFKMIKGKCQQSGRGLGIDLSGFGRFWSLLCVGGSAERDRANATIVQGRFKSLLYKTITRSHPQIVKVRISLGYNWSSEEHVAGSQVARWQ